MIWLVVGFVLIVAEFFLTSFFVIFFGIAAVVVALALWAGLPAGSGAPYLLFAAVAVGTLLVLRSRFREWFTGSYADAGVDEDFVGREVIVESGFDGGSPGRGRVSYRGTAWDARSEQDTFATGARAAIVGRSGMQLHIGPL
ncbi:MAG: NfeD family protein [Pseudomonadota bacterium]